MWNVHGKFFLQNEFQMQALSAVGASYSLTNVFVWVAVVVGIGASVLVSQYFGAGRYSEMKTALNTALISFLVLSVMMGIFGYIFGTPIMRLLNTPDDVLDMASVYHIQKV